MYNVDLCCNIQMVSESFIVTENSSIDNDLVSLKQDAGSALRQAALRPVVLNITPEDAPVFVV